MNLNEILQAAQGGQGVNNLAAQFGLSPAQTQAAIQAMIPAFSTGLQRTAQDPSGLGGLLTQLASGVHLPSYTDPGQTMNASGLGGNVLGQIFGTPQVAAQVGQQASQASGVNPQVIAQMMPVVASMIMGGLMHNLNAQGLGGILGQLANAAATPGGFAPGAPAPGAAAPPPGGMFGGMFNSMLGGLLGGATPQGTPATPQTAILQAGLNTLTSMLQAGVQVSQAHQQGLNEILQSIANATKT